MRSFSQLLEPSGPVMPCLVLITGGMDCGGAQRVLADIASYWAEKGWHVTLATWSSAHLPDFYALPPAVRRVWLHVDRRGPSLFANVRVFVGRVLRLRRLLREITPDFVLSFIDVSNIHTIFAALGLETRVVVSERTNPCMNHTISGSSRLLRRLCYRWADQVVAQTEDAARWLNRECKTQTLVIPNSLRPLPEPRSPREHLIVAVGRLSAEKGFDVLLKAFARVLPHHPDWQLRILGEGAERAALSELIASLHLEHNAGLLGQVQEVDAWMARAGLMVHPSRREGFPNAVLEAMAMGVAVICADCRSGPSELIQNGVNGRLVPVDDVEAFARVMSELMSSSKPREQLGAEALKVRQLYRQSTIMQNWEACVLPKLSAVNSNAGTHATNADHPRNSHEN